MPTAVWFLSTLPNFEQCIKLVFDDTNGLFLCIPTVFLTHCCHIDTEFPKFDAECQHCWTFPDQDHISLAVISTILISMILYAPITLTIQFHVYRDSTYYFIFSFFNQYPSMYVECHFWSHHQ